jgi:hypothetical protein
MTEIQSERPGPVMRIAFMTSSMSAVLRTPFSSSGRALR